MTSSGGSTSDELKSVNLQIVKDETCSKFQPHYPAEMICAGVLDDSGNVIGGSDACQGDSGGPLVCEIDGYVVLAGATRKGYYLLICYQAKMVDFADISLN